VPVDEVERRARMLMSWIAEPGDLAAAILIRRFGAAALLERLTAADPTGAHVDGWRQRAHVADLDQLQKSADSVQARYICPGDAEWPPALDDLERFEEATGDRRASAPIGLWVRGERDVAAITRRAVSFVGARASTAYGEHVAGELAASCGVRGFTAVSGGAYGIDAAAHRGALACASPTVAVLAGGIDRLYPPGNTSLLRSVAREGLVLTEAAPGCNPSRSRFLVRNRLIAALGLGTVVVEAALRSGALNTARWARDLGREVMGVPGPVTSTTSAGVHELLRQPETMLVTDAAEVVEQVSAIGSGQAPRKEGVVHPRDSLDVDARQILDAVPKHVHAPAASIAIVAGVTTAQALTQLEGLREAGLVEGDDVSGWRLSHE
jgi:DNA processing protein